MRNRSFTYLAAGEDDDYIEAPIEDFLILFLLTNIKITVTFHKASQATSRNGMSTTPTYSRCHIGSDTIPSSRQTHRVEITPDGAVLLPGKDPSDCMDEVHGVTC